MYVAFTSLDYSSLSLAIYHHPSPELGAPANIAVDSRVDLAKDSGEPNFVQVVCGASVRGVCMG